MPYYFYYDSSYLFVAIISLVITLYAQMKIKSAFSKYSRVMSAKGVTGREAAERILSSNGLSSVRIERVSGSLTDHFDPKRNIIRLSESVYDSSSVAALGVAAHEVGHALQYHSGYLPIKLRNVIIPITNFGSSLSVPLIMIGLLMSFEPLIVFGILLFSLVVVFQLITLPVELNASRRAAKQLTDLAIIDEGEKTGVRKVLSGAAMTYLAALLTSVLNLLRYIALFSNRRGRR